VLYLGAGVSCSIGLPTWWTLIQSLTITMMTEQVDSALVRSGAIQYLVLDFQLRLCD
jgi:hypothetical protein